MVGYKLFIYHYYKGPERYIKAMRGDGSGILYIIPKCWNFGSAKIGNQNQMVNLSMLESMKNHPKSKSKIEPVNYGVITRLDPYWFKPASNLLNNRPSVST